MQWHILLQSQKYPYQKKKKYKVKNIHNQQNGTTWQAIYREVVSDRVGTWKLLGSDANLQLLF